MQLMQYALEPVDIRTHLHIYYHSLQEIISQSIWLREHEETARGLSAVK